MLYSLKCEIQNVQHFRVKSLLLGVTVHSAEHIQYNLVHNTPKPNDALSKFHLKCIEQNQIEFQFNLKENEIIFRLPAICMMFGKLRCTLNSIPWKSFYIKLYNKKTTTIYSMLSFAEDFGSIVSDSDEHRRCCYTVAH